VRPERLVIAGQAYEVRWVTDSTAGLARHANSDAVGHTDSNIGVIAVRTHDTTATQERDTFLHVAFEQDQPHDGCHLLDTSVTLAATRGSRDGTLTAEFPTPMSRPLRRCVPAPA
jgi:hypothetical protein